MIWLDRWERTARIGAELPLVLPSWPDLAPQLEAVSPAHLGALLHQFPPARALGLCLACDDDDLQKAELTQEELQVARAVQALGARRAELVEPLGRLAGCLPVSPGWAEALPRLPEEVRRSLVGRLARGDTEGVEALRRRALGACMQQAVTASEGWRFDEAAEQLNTARSLAAVGAVAVEGRWVTAAEGLWNLQQGRFGAARVALEAAWQDLAEGPPSVPTVQASLWLAQLCLMQGRAAEAADLGDRSRRDAVALGAHEQMAVGLAARVIALRLLGDDAALEVETEALSEALSKVESPQAGLHSLMALLIAVPEGSDEALEVADACVDLAERLEGTNWEAEARMVRAKIYLQRNQSKQALDDLHRSSTKFRVSGTLHSASMADFMLARVLLGSEELEQASEAIQRAQAGFAQLGVSLPLATATHLAGQISVAQQELGAARAQFERALALFSTLPQATEDQASTLLLVADVSRRQGDLAQSIGWLRQLLRVLPETESSELRVLGLAMLMKVLHQQGDRSAALSFARQRLVESCRLENSTYRVAAAVDLALLLPGDEMEEEAQVLEEALQLLADEPPSPLHGLALALKGALRSRAGQGAEARSLAERAWTLAQPGTERDRAIIGGLAAQALESAGDTAAAVRIAQEAAPIARLVGLIEDADALDALIARHSPAAPPADLQPQVA